MSDHGHVVKQPFWVFIIRILQVVLAIIILGLAAFSLKTLDDFNYSDDYTNYWGITLFASLWTLLFVAYYLLSTTLFKRAYIWPVVVGMEILAVIFWLVSWACLADGVHKIKKAEDNTVIVGGYYGGYYYMAKEKREVEELAKRNDYDDAIALPKIAKAGLALALIEFFLFVATAVMLALSVRKHHSSGGAFMHGRERGAPSGTTDAEKTNTTPAVPLTEQNNNQQYPPPQHNQQPPYDNSQNVSPYPPAAAPAPYQNTTSPPPPGTHEAPAQY